MAWTQTNITRTLFFQNPPKSLEFGFYCFYCISIAGSNRTLLIYVGDQSGWQNQTECGRGKLLGATSVVTIPCSPEKPVRYLTVREITANGFPLCEVIVDGHLYEGKC